MKFVLFLLSAYLVNNIKADLLSKPEEVIIPREQELSDDSRKDDANTVSVVNEQPKQTIQTAMDTVQENMIGKENFTDREVPEVIVSEPEREINDQSIMNMQPLQQQQTGLPLIRPSNPIFQRIYKLPAVTRMISSEEEPEKENSLFRDVKLPQWRSPLPFMHNHCIHSMNGNNNMNIGKMVPIYPKRLQLNHRRVHRHHKHFLPLMALREPIAEPFGPILLSQYPMMKRIEQPTETLQKPTVIMTIMRRNPESEPQIQDNQVSPHSSLFISLLRRRPRIQENKLLSNPFTSLLSKLLSIPSKDSLSAVKYAKPEEKHQKQNVNYNFNVNFTVNNNNYYKDQKNDNVMQERGEFNRFNRENSLHRFSEGLQLPNLIIPSFQKIMNSMNGKF